MNILMTGGTGLIGRAFIPAHEQHQFTVVTRSPEAAAEKLPTGVLLLEGLHKLKNLDQFDAVINLAGEPIIGKRWSPAQKRRICESRWQTTEDLVELFEKSERPPEVFLSGSAVGVYGNQGDAKLTEAHPTVDSDFASELCSHWETIAKRANPYTRVILLRTGIVLATEGGALAKMLLPFRCFLGGKLGQGSQYMSWIHITDMVNAINQLLSNQSIAGAVNLTAPTPVTNEEFTRQLAEALNRIAFLPAPEFALELLLGEASCLLLDSQRVIPEKLLHSGYNFEYPNLAAALADLL